jgi:hypothetical protein
MISQVPKMTPHTRWQFANTVKDGEVDEDDQVSNTVLQTLVLDRPPLEMRIDQPQPGRNAAPGRTVVPPLGYLPPLRANLPAPPQLGRLRNQRPPYVQHHNHLPEGSGFHNATFLSQSTRVQPPMSDRGAYGAMNGLPYARSMHEMMQRQMQGIQGMGLVSPYAARYGNGGYAASTDSSSSSSLHIRRRGGKAPPSQETGHVDSRSNVAESIQLQQTRGSAQRMGPAVPSLGAPVLRAPSHQSSVFNGQPSTANSRVSTPQQWVDEGQQSAMESRAPSRPVSNQSSAEDLRYSMNSAPADQRDGNARLIVKLPIPRELKQKVPHPSPSFFLF